MRSSSWARTGDFGRTLFSASHIKKALPDDEGVPACMARYAFEKLVGLKEPQTDAMSAGVDKHAEMEDWLEHGIPPRSKAALKALKVTKLKPRSVFVESPVRFDYTGDDGETTSWLGFIDFCYEDTDPEVAAFAEDGDADFFVVGDWKFTSKIANAKSPEYLQDDAAATIYAYEAYLAGARFVRGRWVYVTQDGSAHKEVWFDLPPERVLHNMEKLHRVAVELTEHKKKFRLGLLKPLDLGRNERRCYDFRRPCHLMGKECTPPSPKKFSLRGADTMTSFEERMKAFPGAQMPSTDGPQKKAPPPIPGKKGPPPLPGKKTVDIDAKWAEMKKDMPQRTDEEIGVPCKEPVNSPEAPDVAPRTPEEAAEMQGEKKPEPPPPDDLDAMDRDALKQLGIDMGLWTKSKSSREKSMREEIRHARKNGYQTISGTTVEEIDERQEAANQAACTAEQEYAEQKATELTEVVHEVEVQEPAAKSAQASTMLLINCEPMHGSLDPNVAISQSELVRRAHDELGVPDFRLIDYGKGPGELACAVRQLFSEDRLGGALVFCLDTRTQAGAALVDTLVELCDVVIRGF